MAVESQASPEPRYGVMWFTARTQVDKESRMVTLEDLTVSRVDFPTAPGDGAGYLAALQRMFSDEPLTIALDRLQAELEVERAEDPERVVAVRNDPPRIIVSQTPALLVRVDGQPVLRTVPGSAYLRVINTRVLLLLDRAAGRYYLWLRNQWVAAATLDGPWTVVSDPSAALDAAKQAAAQGGQVDLLDDAPPELAPMLQAGETPTVYVSTIPAVLLTVRGDAGLRAGGRHRAARGDERRRRSLPVSARAVVLRPALRPVVPREGARRALGVRERGSATEGLRGHPGGSSQG